MQSINEFDNGFGDENSMNKLNSNGGLPSTKQTFRADTWTVDQTKCLLDLYHLYMDEINGIFNTKKTGEQISKRYTAIIRQKKDDVNKNRASGAVRREVEYQEEVDKITAADDSIEPEVMRGINFVQYKNKDNKQYKDTKISKPPQPRWDKPNKKHIINSITDCMHKIESRRLERENKKEQRRIERHEQFLEVLRSFKKE